MSVYNGEPVSRTEDFFRLVNNEPWKTPFLTTRGRFATVLGLLGVSAGKAEEVMDAVDQLLRRDGIPNLKTKAGQNWRESTTAEVRTQHPEVFGIAFHGPEEEQFVEEKAIHAMIRFSMKLQRKEVEKTRKRAARAAITARKAAADADSQAECAAQEIGHDEEDLESEGDGDTIAADDEIEEATPLLRQRSPASSDSSSSHAAPETPTKKVANNRLPDKTIEVWSAMEARSLVQIELKDLVEENGRVPSYNLLQQKIWPLLATNANPPCILPGRLEFVHVLYDGLNTGIISQEVLSMEWNDWRQNNSNGKRFRLWVKDCPSELIHLKSQPPFKYGSGGWEYHPLVNGPPRYLRLPLKLRT